MEEDVKVLHPWTGAAAIAAMLLLAACGSGSSGAASTPRSPARTPAAAGTPTPVGSPPAMATLDRQVRSAIANATSVHITVPDGQGTGGYGLDIGLTRSNDMYGDVTYNNQSVTVLARGGRAYMKLTAGAVKAMGLPSAVCVMVCGKYMELSASDSKSMLAGAGWSDLVGSMVGSPSATPGLHYVGTVTVDGQPAWELAANGATAYVAARGTPYPLRLVKGTDRIDYTQWNQVTIPPAPPASQVIDLSQLQQLGQS
jgi:hypothetical protein